jgi:hypothetical protein
MRSEASVEAGPRSHPQRTTRNGIAVAIVTRWAIAWLAHHRRILVAGSVKSFVRETAGHSQAGDGGNRGSHPAASRTFSEIRPTA